MTQKKHQNLSDVKIIRSSTNKSDHNAIKFTFYYENQNLKDKYKERTKRAPLKIKINWSCYEQRLKYQERVRAKLPRLLELTKDVEQERDKKVLKSKLEALINELTNTLITATKDTYNETKSDFIKSKRKFKPWWNSTIKELHQKMVAIYLEYKETGFDTQKKSEYQQLHRQFRRQKRLNISLKKEGHLKKLDSLFKLNKVEFWKEIKKSDKTRPQVDIATSTLKKHFQDTFTKTNKILENQDIQLLKNAILSYVNSNSLKTYDCKIESKNLNEVIRNLPNNKSTGLSMLSNEMIKYSENETVTDIIKLVFEKMINHQIIPFLFNLSKIKPIVKSNEKSNSDIDNVRPIAISEALSNIYENILLKFLETHITENRKQFGFKKKSSCSHAVFCLKQAIAAARTMNKRLYVCAIDTSKAFDKVIREKLWIELINDGIPEFIIMAFINYYDSSLMIIFNLGEY